MISIDPRELTRQQATALVNGLVAPRPIAWVSTLARDGTRNLAPFSFFNAFSSAPFTIGIGPGSREGVNKDSLRNIKDTGEFTISAVSEELAPLTNLTSAELDPSVDEWELVGLTPRPSTSVRPPYVSESAASLECRVLQIVDLGPPEVPTNSLVIARVVCVHVAEHVVDEDFRVDAAALGLVGRMGGDLWCTTRDRFRLRRPTIAEAFTGPIPIERPDDYVTTDSKEARR